MSDRQKGPISLQYDYVKPAEVNDDVDFVQMPTTERKQKNEQAPSSSNTRGITVYIVSRSNDCRTLVWAEGVPS